LNYPESKEVKQMKPIIKIIMVMMMTAAAAFPLTAAEEISLNLSLANPVLADSGIQTTYLRIGLTGFRMETEGERPAINTALVLDRSGSMSGEKIAQAVQAAHTALEMLRNGDAVSIITYSDGAEVVIPATVLDRRNRNRFHQVLDGIYASGNTALFAGVAMGGRELDTYLQEERVNRVILLSDGMANVGPSSPGELGNLGETLRRRDISVSTIGLGLGYNADLMYELAARSDGNHAFVESPSELAGIFRREFESIMAVVAKDVEIRISCAPGIRPVRLLNRDGELYGNQVVVSLNQLYSLQEQYVLIEVEVDPETARGQGNAAEVTVDYLNLDGGGRDRLSRSVAMAFSSREEEVAARRDRKTLADVTLQIATATNEQALRMREEGKVEEARELLKKNAEILAEAASEYGGEELEEYAQENLMSADRIADDSVWEQEQKSMRASQYGNRTQQSYR
jgi:Ca-activated chloride channel family protein